MSNKKINTIMKWSYRILCTVGAIVIAVCAITLDNIGSEEMAIIIAAIGLLSWQTSRKSQQPTEDEKPRKGNF